jgi:hypothetical protein
MGLRCRAPRGAADGRNINENDSHYDSDYGFWQALLDIKTNMRQQCDGAKLAAVLLRYGRINYNTGDKGLS